MGSNHSFADKLFAPGVSGKTARCRYFDKEQGKTYVFLTNNFEIEALEVAHLHKYRWQIELF